MNNESLSTTAAVYMWIGSILIPLILLVAIWAQVADIRTELDNGGQVYDEKLQALTIENTVLLEENEMLKDSYADMAGDLRAVREILKQLNYETILVEPEATDIWIQTCVDYLEGD